MLEIAVWSAALVVSLFLLVRGANGFILAAETLGLAFGLSRFIIGVTIVGVGTSLPELMSGIAGVLVGQPEIAVATAVGSNITNILLVLSVAALLGGGLRVDVELVRVDLPFLFGSAVLLALFAFDGEVGRVEALLGIAALCVYLVYAGREPDHPHTTVSAAAAHIDTPEPAGTLGVWLRVFVGAAFIQLGAYLTVESVVHLGTLLDVGSDVLAASVIAFGTSLPELSVTIYAARSGKPEIAVGNVIGSNIFNALGVVGGSALFGTLTIQAPMLYFALPAMLAVTVLCFFVLQEREMTQWDGWLLLILYIAYTANLYGIT